MVPTLIITVLLLSLLGMILAINSYSNIKVMLADEANSTVDFIAKVSVNSYKNYEYFYLDTLVQEIRKGPEVDYAVFYDANGVALTKASESIFPSFIEVTRTITEENGTTLGSLKIGFNRTAIDTNLHSSLVIISISICVVILIFVFGMKMLTERVVVSRILEMEELSEKMANGDLTVVINVIGHDEISSLGRTINKMADTLKELISKTMSRNSELEDWQRSELKIKSSLNDFNKILRDEQNIADLAKRSLAFMAEYLGSGVGVIYRFDETENLLRAIATFACANTERLRNGVQLGEGLAGQAALERRTIALASAPPDYLPISSAMGERDPLNIVIMPILLNDTLIGVLELGSFRLFSDSDYIFLKQSLEGLAVAININRSRQLVDELLEQTQSQAEELRVQQEELQQTNEELLERTRIAGG